MELYRRAIFTQPAVNTQPCYVQLPPINDIWPVITSESIREARPVKSVSPDPVELTVTISEQYRLRCSHGSSMLSYSVGNCLPTFLSQERSIFPIKDEPYQPVDFRPIFIISGVTKHPRKVLTEFIDG